MRTYEVILEDGNKILLSAYDSIDAIKYLAEQGMIEYYDQVVQVRVK